MKNKKTDISIKALQFAVGVVVLVEACILAFNPRAIEAFARTGLPNWIRVVLAWSEIIAAILFLAPPTMILGAWFLLVVFFGAALVHIAHGNFNVGALLVYSIAVIVVMKERACQRAMAAV